MRMRPPRTGACASAELVGDGCNPALCTRACCAHAPPTRRRMALVHVAMLVWGCPPPVGWRPPPLVIRFHCRWHCRCCCPVSARAVVLTGGCRSRVVPLRTGSHLASSIHRGMVFGRHYYWPLRHQKCVLCRPNRKWAFRL
jgi:hypothetical protein